MASSSNGNECNECSESPENGARRKVVQNDNGDVDDESPGPSNELAQLERLVPNRPPREAERKFSFPERGFQANNEFSDSSDDEEGAVGGDGEIVQARNPYPAGRGRNEERPVSPSTRRISLLFCFSLVLVPPSQRTTPSCFVLRASYLMAFEGRRFNGSTGPIRFPKFRALRGFPNRDFAKYCSYGVDSRRGKDYSTFVRSLFSKPKMEHAVGLFPFFSSNTFPSR